MLHRRVKRLGEHKTDTGLFDTILYLQGRQIDFDAQGFQHIGTAALAAGGPVAVFGYFNTRGRGDESGGGRNVKGAGTVAARPHDIQ